MEHDTHRLDYGSPAHLFAERVYKLEHARVRLLTPVETATCMFSYSSVRDKGSDTICVFIDFTEFQITR